MISLHIFINYIFICLVAVDFCSLIGKLFTDLHEQATESQITHFLFSVMELTLFMVL